MKKLLITAPHLISHGGGEQLVLDYFTHFKKKYEVTIWTWKINWDTTFNEFAKNKKMIKEIGFACSYAQKLLTWAQLRTKEYTIVIAGGFPSYFCAFSNKNIFAKIMIIPAYVTNPILFPLKLIDGAALKKCKKVIVDCPSMQQKILETYNCPSVVILPGIDQHLYYQGRNENYFVHVSRLDPEKNVDKLILAWNLKEKLVLIGNGKLEYVQKLMVLAKGKNIKFLGSKNKKELATYYANARAILLAAENEPFGLVILEAFASGKPVIAINRGGPKDLLAPKLGFLANTHQELVGYAKILAQNPDTAKTMGNAALKESKKYTLKKYLKRFEKELQ